MDSGVDPISCGGLQIPDEFRCCICLCAQEKVLLMHCSHRVCISCADCAGLKLCPVCCKEVPKERQADAEFAELALNTRLSCACGIEVPLLEADQHDCEKTRVSTSSLLYHGKAAQKHVNRSTFNCPLCQEPNLSRQGLLEHCQKYHLSAPARAICPICASMPWGDPSYYSNDFVQHLQLRHKCDYDVLADYNASEEESVRRALQASVDGTEDDILAQILKQSAEEVDPFTAFGQSDDDDMLAFALAESMKDSNPEKIESRIA
mmetsp:Transcript_91640/g.144897  ORF Transcript_91640/g.144897 Transcript_91640/m.144897 type:complete len:263 (+) Transcript_91640:58-846(+)